MASLPSERDVPTPQALRRSWVAARLAGVGIKKVPDWCSKQGLPSGSASSFERAVGPIRATSPLKGERGRPGKRQQKATPILRDWLLVDEEALGVVKIIYRIPNDGRRQRDLIRKVREEAGVRQILETGSDRELIVVALFADTKAARRLRETLESFATDRTVKMDVVEFEDNQQAALAWRALAKES